MIPFLAVAGAKASGIFKAIPRWAWYALAAALVLFLIYRWHNGKVEDAYAKGKADEGARIAAKAFEIKRKADELTASISTALRTRHDEKVRIIYRDADALRLRGPGKAACPGNPGIPRGASGSAKPIGERVASVAEVPPGERVDLIGLPFAATVSGAEQCDLNRAEAKTWREWYAKQSEAWQKIGR